MDKNTFTILNDFENYRIEKITNVLIEICNAFGLDGKKGARFLGSITNYFDIKDRIISKYSDSYNSEFLEVLCKVVIPPVKMHELISKIKRQRKNSNDILKTILNIVNKDEEKSVPELTYNISIDHYSYFYLNDFLNNISLKIIYNKTDYNILTKNDLTKSFNSIVICTNDVTKNNTSDINDTITYVIINKNIKIIQCSKVIFTFPLTTNLNQIITLAIFYHNIYLFYFLIQKDNKNEVPNKTEALRIKSLFNFYINHFYDKSLFTIALIKRLGESVNSIDKLNDFSIIIKYLPAKYKYLLNYYLKTSENITVKRLQKHTVRVLPILFKTNSTSFIQKITNYFVLIQQQEKIEKLYKI